MGWSVMWCGCIKWCSTSSSKKVGNQLAARRFFVLGGFEICFLFERFTHGVIRERVDVDFGIIF